MNFFKNNLMNNFGIAESANVISSVDLVSVHALENSENDIFTRIDVAPIIIYGDENGISCGSPLPLFKPIDVDPIIIYGDENGISCGSPMPVFTPINVPPIIIYGDENGISCGSPPQGPGNTTQPVGVSPGVEVAYSGNPEATILPVDTSPDVSSAQSEDFVPYESDPIIIYGDENGISCGGPMPVFTPINVPPIIIYGDENGIYCGSPPSGVLHQAAPAILPTADAEQRDISNVVEFHDSVTAAISDFVTRATPADAFYVDSIQEVTAPHAFIEFAQSLDELTKTQIV